MTARHLLPMTPGAVSPFVPGSPGAGMTALMWRWVRKGAVTVVGMIMLAGGTVMLVLPGPGVAVILAGLALLGTEYGWAARILAHIRQYVSRIGGPVWERWRSRRVAQEARESRAARSRLAASSATG
jgi:uncharacterized protein (TIGR02611 family)